MTEDEVSGRLWEWLTTTFGVAVIHAHQEEHVTRAQIDVELRCVLRDGFAVNVMDQAARPAITAL